MNVFVYGTLKPGEANYQLFCARKVVEEVEAIAYGLLYDLPLGYPAMTIGDKPIQGFVLTFADPIILESLDELEDYQPERSPQENEYYRKLIKTFNQNGDSLGDAWVYLMSPQRVKYLGGTLLPTGYWSCF